MDDNHTATEIAPLICHQMIVGSSALEIIRILCNALNNNGISYCQWKSTAGLDRSVMGENDLDLLVSRVDAFCFMEILIRLGFKQAVSSPDSRVPGIMNFFGLDKPTGKLVHVHAHFQLILGHDLTKNYHLPIEQAYLSACTLEDIIRIPSADFEWILFVFRMILKHSTWDTILGRQGKFTPREQNEWNFLKDRVDPSQVERLLLENIPQVDRDLFAACVQALHAGCSMWMRIRTGAELQKALSIYARQPQTVDLWLKLIRRVSGAFRRRVLKRSPKMHLSSGGALIAVVGGDGAGKSTAIDGLTEWLSDSFDIKKVHLGKPQWSKTTILFRGILKLGRSLGLYPFVREPVQYFKNPGEQAFPGYPWLIREVCTARDRYCTYLQGRRFAANGGLVLCDRYPLPQIKLMDGPQGERMLGTQKNTWLDRLLVKWEKDYYRSIQLPDVLIVLKVNPEIAVQRKVDEDQNSVRARSSEVWETDWTRVPAEVIDASLPKEEVLSRIKYVLWSEL